MKPPHLAGDRVPRTYPLLLVALAFLGTAACGPNPAASGAPGGTVSCTGVAPKAIPTPVAAKGDQYSGSGIAVTTAASLDPSAGVNGTIDVTVTVSCPSDVSDVAVWQSYEAYGSTVSSRLSEVSHSGDTWSFALFADNLSGSHPYTVGLYRQTLSGSGQPPFVMIVFEWPRSLRSHMAA